MLAIFILGVIGGVALAAVGMVVAMRSMMITVKPSPHDLATTISLLEKGIADANWSLVDSKRLNQNLEKHGVSFAPQVHLMKICKAPYAAQVLKDARRMACLMPCTVAVYETDGGQVHISKMNTGLMGKVFGGTVARVMGGYVASDEATILGKALRP